jgi:hypothetical protein
VRVPDEKTAIARRYLEPQSRADSGVPDQAVDLTDEAMGTLIEEYCRSDNRGQGTGGEGSWVRGTGTGSQASVL